MKTLLVLLLASTFAHAENAHDLLEDVNPNEREQIRQVILANGIDPEKVDIDLNLQERTIEISGDLSRKNALFLGTRLGFPLLVGLTAVYKHEGPISFNITLNAQTVILASYYHAGIAWNYYKGFFIGMTGGIIHTESIFGGSSLNSYAFGPQIGWQKAFGATQRWYVDGRLELIVKDKGLIPNASMALGVRLF